MVQGFDKEETAVISMYRGALAGQFGVRRLKLAVVVVMCFAVPADASVVIPQLPRHTCTVTVAGASGAPWPTPVNCANATLAGMGKKSATTLSRSHGSWTRKFRLPLGALRLVLCDSGRCANSGADLTAVCCEAAPCRSRRSPLHPVQCTWCRTAWRCPGEGRVCHRPRSGITSRSCRAVLHG